eukprot:4861601-Pleurochrysis_carterae.AAC.1
MAATPDVQRRQRRCDGCEDWLPSSLALALQSLGLLDGLLRTKMIAQIRFELVEELAELL